MPGWVTTRRWSRALNRLITGLAGVGLVRQMAFPVHCLNASGTAVGLDLLQDAEQGLGMGHAGEVDDLVGPAQHLDCGLPADRLDAASRQLSVALLAALQGGQQFVGR